MASNSQICKRRKSKKEFADFHKLFTDRWLGVVPFEWKHFDERLIFCSTSKKTRHKSNEKYISDEKNGSVDWIIASNCENGNIVHSMCDIYEFRYYVEFFSFRIRCPHIHTIEMFNGMPNAYLSILVIRNDNNWATRELKMENVHLKWFGFVLLVADRALEGNVQTIFSTQWEWASIANVIFCAHAIFIPFNYVYASSFNLCFIFVLSL